MKGQLEALLKHGERPTVRIQVLPFDAPANLLIGGAVSILTSPNQVSVVCVEAFRTASVVEDPEHVRTAVRAYDELIGEAYSTRESRRVIAEQIGKLS